MDGDARRATTQRVGRIVSVEGNQAVCMLEHDQSGAVAPLQIGSLVKIRVGASTVFGTTRGVSIPVPSLDRGDSEMKMVELTLIGEISAAAPLRPALFRRGISAFPTLGDAVHLAEREDLMQVYAPPTATNVSLGVLHHDRTIHAHALVDELLGKHFAVFGTTGSGKSCAAAVILRSVIAQNANAHILVLDPHGEYARAFPNRAEVIGVGDLELPHWLLCFDELLQAIFGPGIDMASAEAEILAELVTGAKMDFIGRQEHYYDPAFSVDTPVPYRLSDLLVRLDNEMGRLENKTNLAPYRRIKNRLLSLQGDTRFAFMFGSVSVRDRLGAILSRLFRLPADGKPVCVVDLSGVPSDVLPVVVATLCRLTYTFAVCANRSCPVLLVCEEAHRYAPQVASEAGFELSKNWLTRIAKEGRKYGVSLCVISQRPSKLATDLMSQCNTIFALRLSNFEDQHFLTGASVLNSAAADTTMGLHDFLPTLLSGEAIIVGQGVAMPIRMRFHTLPEDERPGSGATTVTDAWRTPMENAALLPSVVSRWRAMRR
jgi:DNA helicase HerA-like ATPase